MKYKSWQNTWGGIGIGFDKSELTNVTFHVSGCFQHRYFDLDFALLGLILDVHFFEGEPDGPEVGPGSGA
jgi:hypothetical protein